MKKGIKKIIIAIILLLVTLLSFLWNNTFAANTDYFDENQKDEKGIGVAVIENEGVDVKSYFYLFYDDKGEVHTVQYMMNPMSTEEKDNKKKNENKDKKWILKTDADNFKAKELGAKESYKSEKDIEADESKEATELYKKIAKDVGNTKTLYDYIEGTDDNLEPYTIESIVFNEVPLFDVNVFSEKAGGKEIKDDSPVAIIRKLVAVWFVSLRNITYVVLALLIIYYGIRIAISTVASEKAVYKQMMMGWLKSLILAMYVHIIMFAILNFNEILVNTFKNVNEKEESIYNTIKTRALEVPWKISIPALLLYLTLLLMWLRFLWTYLKRVFTVSFYIILAPLVVGKYAIESASGKGSQMVSKLLQKFSTAVLIQSIHAMLYVAFVENALKIALESLHGFFIALFFLNFILSADAIVAKIFENGLHKESIKEMDKPFKLKDQLAGAYITYGVTKKFIGAVDDVAVVTGKSIKDGVYKGYLKATDTIDDISGGNSREAIEKAINEKLDKIDDLFINQKYDENGKPINMSGIRGDLNNYFVLRKMSRAKGWDGVHARRILKLKKNATTRRLKSNFRIIKDIGTGAAETIFAIPVGVQNPTAGITLMANVPGRFRRSRDTVKTMRNKDKKYNKHLDDVVQSYMIVNHNEDIIEEEIELLTEEEREVAIDEMRKVNQYNINTLYLTTKIKEIVTYRNIQQIDDSTLEEIIDEILVDMPEDIDNNDRIIIKQRAIEIVRQNIYESEVGQNNKKTEQQARDETEREQSKKHKTKQDEDQEQQSEAPDSADSTYGNQAGQNEYQTESAKESVEQEEREQETREQEDNDEEKTDRDKKDRRDRRDREESEDEDRPKKRITYNWGDIAEAIEEAVIETKVDNKFAKMARAIDNIKDANMKEARKDDSDGEVADVNRFINSL